MNGINLEKHLLVYCPKCRKYKFYSKFHYSSVKKNGCYSCCKECRKAMDARRYDRIRLGRFLDEIRDVFDRYGVTSTISTTTEIIGAYHGSQLIAARKDG